MPNLVNQKVKIVATLGPRTDNEENILKIARAGVRIMRVNFSHIKSFDEAQALIKNIRSAEATLKRPIAILGDLAGPKIRIGEVKNYTELKSGRKVKVISKKVLGKSEEISLNYPSIIKNLRPGTEAYLGDGSIKLKILQKIKGGVVAKVLVGGMLRSRMGFAAQGVKRPTFALQTKDIKDIKTGLTLNVDAFAVSFVEDKDDILRVKKLLPKHNPPLIFAKMETEKSIRNAEGIINAADGLLIARGDLGFAVPLPELPFIQKQLIQLCLRKSKPVITATQMLESMTQNPYPTRAEVTDVTKAILDGTDAVMLSGETAIGAFPVEAVRTMSDIINHAVTQVSSRRFPDEQLVADAVSASTIQAAHQIGAKIIVVFTDSGATARRIARHRAKEPIIALTPNKNTFRKLRFTWGVFPYLIENTKSFDEIMREAHRYAKNNGVLSLKAGELFVISAGLPLGQAGTTNLLLVQRT